MITLSLFPCSFTDGARIIGELSNALDKPVYTDEMVLNEVVVTTGRSLKKLKSSLYFEGALNDRTYRDKDRAIEQIKQVLARLVCDSRDWIYYGMFSSLLQREPIHTLHTLIIADEHCRVERAVKREKVVVEKALHLIHGHDAQALAWTRFLFGTQPYDESLYDVVIHFNCQDLMDVVAWICVKYEEHMGLPATLAEASTTGCDASIPVIQASLLSRGIKAEITQRKNDLVIQLDASPPFFSRLAPAVLDTVCTIQDLQNVRVIHAHKPEVRVDACPLPNHTLPPPAVPAWLQKTTNAGLYKTIEKRRRTSSGKQY